MEEDQTDAEKCRLEKAKELMRSKGYEPIDPKDDDGPWILVKR